MTRVARQGIDADSDVGASTSNGLAFEFGRVLSATDLPYSLFDEVVHPALAPAPSPAAGVGSGPPTGTRPPENAAPSHHSVCQFVVAALAAVAAHDMSGTAEWLEQQARAVELIGYFHMLECRPSKDRTGTLTWELCNDQASRWRALVDMWFCWVYRGRPPGGKKLHTSKAVSLGITTLIARVST